MRTTLTLDEDVAAAIAKRRRERGTGLRDEINELLRNGLIAAEHDSSALERDYALPTFDSGRQLIADPKLLKELLDDEDLERYLR